MTRFRLSPGTLCPSCFERCQEQAFSVPWVALGALSLGLGGATGGVGLPAAALRPRQATSVSCPPVFPPLHSPSFSGLPATGLGPPHGRGASCRQGRAPTLSFQRHHPAAGACRSGPQAPRPVEGGAAAAPEPRVWTELSLAGACLSRKGAAALGLPGGRPLAGSLLSREPGRGSPFLVMLFFVVG